MKLYLHSLVVSVMILLAAAAAQANTVYKWTDQDGTVTYGQTPPHGVDAVPVEGARTPAQRDDPPQGGGIEEEAVAAEEPDEGQPRQVQADDEEAMAAACQAARDNEAVLENPAVRRIRDEDGNYMILEEEAREERLRETREFIDTWCN